MNFHSNIWISIKIRFVLFQDHQLQTLIKQKPYIIFETDNTENNECLFREVINYVYFV